MLRLVACVLMLAGQSEPTPRELAVFTGNELLSSCEKYEKYDHAARRLTADETAAAGMCAAYVSGFVDASTTYNSLLSQLDAALQKSEADGARVRHRISPMACIPEGATYEQTVRVVLKYLRDHPEKLHERRSTLMLEAIASAFPCPKE